MFQLLGLSALCLVVIAAVGLFVAKQWNSGMKVVSNSVDSSKIDALSSQNSTIAHEAALKKAETLFQTAQLYLKEQKNGKKKNNIKAFDCFLEAAQLGCHDALAPLERLGEEASGTKQRELCNLYKNNGFFKNSERADYWDAKAKEVEANAFNLF